jgi:hypothetical protein
MFTITNTIIIAIITMAIIVQLTLSLSVQMICSSQFTENVSPRSNRSIHGVPPSVKEPVRSRIHELTSANYAQPKLTVTLIAKFCIHEICTIHCSFNSWSPIYHISNIDRMVVEKHQLSAFCGCIFKAAVSILKIS